MDAGREDYYTQRMHEELTKAQHASSLEVRHVHETLAKLYRIRLAAITGERCAAA